MSFRSPREILRGTKYPLGWVFLTAVCTANAVKGVCDFVDGDTDKKLRRWARRGCSPFVSKDERATCLSRIADYMNENTCPDGRTKVLRTSILSTIDRSLKSESFDVQYQALRVMCNLVSGDVFARDVRERAALISTLVDIVRKDAGEEFSAKDRIANAFDNVRRGLNVAPLESIEKDANRESTIVLDESRLIRAINTLRVLERVSDGSSSKWVPEVARCASDLVAAQTIVLLGDVIRSEDGTVDPSIDTLRAQSKWIHLHERVKEVHSIVDSLVKTNESGVCAESLDTLARTEMLCEQVSNSISPILRDTVMEVIPTRWTVRNVLDHAADVCIVGMLWGCLRAVPRMRSHIIGSHIALGARLSLIARCAVMNGLGTGAYVTVDSCMDFFMRRKMTIESDAINVGVSLLRYAVDIAALYGLFRFISPFGLVPLFFFPVGIRDGYEMDGNAFSFVDSVEWAGPGD